MLLVPCLGSGLVLDKAMRRNLVWLRPTLFGSVLAVILTVDLSNQWEVPIAQIPREFYERYVDMLDTHAEKEVLRKLANEGNVQAQYVYALRHTA